MGGGREKRGGIFPASPCLKRAGKERSTWAEARAGIQPFAYGSVHMSYFVREERKKKSRTHPSLGVEREGKEREEKNLSMAQALAAEPKLG